MRSSKAALILCLIMGGLVLASPTSWAGTENVAPAFRSPPTVLDAVRESWNGYDRYDGYFWTFQSFFWTEAGLTHLKQRSSENRNGHLVYEFRRGHGRDAAANAPNEHWDGAWARTEERCWWFFVCIGHPEQVVYTEYITNLPWPNNSGLEEFDGWFSSVNNYYAVIIPQLPPSFQFDWCLITENLNPPDVCDEEYEVGAEPATMEPYRSYYVSLKFRTDEADGTLPTEWQVSYSLEKIGWVPYIYSTLYDCMTETGNWAIDLDSYSHLLPGSYSSAPENCVDSDDDGFANSEDNCRFTYNPDQANADGDALGDACDPCPFDLHDDSDGDGICDSADVFPTDPNNDTDGDGVRGSIDNCPANPNPDQRDTDGDGRGDVCDSDDDGDGCSDAGDAFPLDGSECVDSDGDGTGNNADPDDDNDCYIDTVETSLGTDSFDPVSFPADFEHDCSPDAMDRDDDNDGVDDVYDPFPRDPAEWSDWDGDGIGDNADPDDDNDGASDVAEIAAGTNPRDPVLGPRDTDHDGFPDVSDPDDDNDGVADAADVFPLDPSESRDSDGDGIGDNADRDDDNDLYTDATEMALGTDPLNSSSKPADFDRDLIPDAYDPDDDNDGTPDTSDAFPFDSSETTDTDRDGIGNNADTDDDNDFMPDAYEIEHGLDPLVNDAGGDKDGDGFTNIDEYYNGTDPDDAGSVPPFCGSSTEKTCDSDSDCNIGGCSGQVCKGISESIVTVCDVRSCYDSSKYGLNCMCFDHKCRWTEPFCGSSTRKSCSVNSDCNVGGCSGQICKGTTESIMSVCDARDCYSAGSYGLSCGCLSNQCQWR